MLCTGYWTLNSRIPPMNVDLFTGGVQGCLATADDETKIFGAHCEVFKPTYDCKGGRSCYRFEWHNLAYPLQKAEEVAVSNIFAMVVVDLRFPKHLSAEVT